MRYDEPLVETGAIAGAEQQARIRKLVGAGLRKIRKRIDSISALIDRSLIGKSMPLETAVFQFDPVTLIRNARGFILSFVIRTSNKEQCNYNGCSTRDSHVLDTSAATCRSGQGTLFYSE